jgi:GxxExxY protein
MAAFRKTSFLEPELSDRVLDAYFEVRKALRPHHLESVYREAMMIAFEDMGIPCEKEVPIPVHFRGRLVGHFRSDLLVAQRVMLELKATREDHHKHGAQLLNCMCGKDVRVGYLLNFGPRGTFTRFVL